MPRQAFPYSFIYNDINKVQLYWNKFKPAKSNGVTDKEEWKTRIPFLEQISAHNCVQVFIWNVLTNRFIYEVDKRDVTGYDASLYLAENGVDFSMSNIHPNFLTPWLIMQQKAFDYMYLNKAEINKIVTNYDLVYRKSNGTYMHFLQQSVCIKTDNDGCPILFLSYIHDITYIKKENTTNLIVTAPNEVKWWNFNFDTSTLETVQPLSRQEKKILAYLANGKSSKNVAIELFISPYTVDTHRKHLLHKTNCIDTTGMITYARLVGLL